MTSEAYVWIWLPEKTEPVVCGRLWKDNGSYQFVYGQNYLARTDAIALDPADLPLAPGVFRPEVGEIHGVLRDAAPDAWGRRVLLYRAGGQALTELDYLLRAGPDRIGALDVTTDAQTYAPDRTVEPPSLENLLSAVEKLDAGEPLPEALNNALVHGSSVGGARPKALLNGDGRKWIAKFSSATDIYPVVRSEFATMWLAGQCGIPVPDVRLQQVLGKDVLLIERFDRRSTDRGMQRRFMISALTALRLHESEAELASYVDLAGFIRRRGKAYPAEAKDLYRRMVFNILVGNTDDHARNQAFFWDGREYELTPAYDISPMLRSGLTASQAMIVGRQGRLSTLENALSEAGQFGLSQDEAKTMHDELIAGIESLWPEAAEQARFTKDEAARLRQVTVLSPGCFYQSEEP